MFVFIDMLYIEQNEVGIVQKFFMAGDAVFIFFVKSYARRIQRGMDTFRFENFEKPGYKFNLQKRLSARNGYAAAFYIAFIFERGCRKLFRRYFFTRAERPCIGIVTISATHRTALHKRHKTYPRTVYGTERFY